ncbi:MAG TPA: hybrid sensor histidine kinase/response regulator, partial [Myxococcaceae bacterium]|nr:hybrid sensor histidine kinase/response regulator [Myxococcaceae bacterium]
MAHRIPRRADRGALAKVLPLGDRGRVARTASLPMVDPESFSTERAIAEMAACITESAVVAQAQRAQLGIVQELFRARACFLVEYVPRTEQLQVVIVRGRNDKRIAAARPGRGPIGRAFSEKRVVREGALAAAPLWSPMAVTGCLVLLAPARTFSDELLAALAAQVS